MGLTLTGKSKSTAGENWGMGLLLVFFSEDSPPSSIADHNNLFPSSSLPSSGRRSNYNLLTKAQSTISVCALLVFVSLLLFTLSTFEPTIKMNLAPPRRLLSQKSMPIEVRTPLENRWNWFGKMWKQKSPMGKTTTDAVPTAALQRMGTLYMRGTRAMADLTVVHVSEDVGEEDLRLFLRLFHRSGVTAKSDSVFVFPSPVFSSRFGSIIREENELFLKLLGRYRNLNGTANRSAAAGFDVTQFLKKREKKEPEEPIWGKKVKRLVNDSNGGEDELTRLSYGSVVSFDAAEIDPENSLSGFSDHIPMSLRRWACYPMLLGRVRRNFKHVMLVDAKNSLLLGDPLGRVRNKGAESVILFPNKHSKRNSEKSNSHQIVNPAIVIGGARGIRRLSNAAVVEIARILMQHKKKNWVSDSGVLSHLVNSEFLLKNVKVIMATESIPEASSLAGVELDSVGSWSAAEKKMFQRGNNGNSREINSIIMKKICSSEIDSCVYSDC